MKISEIRYNSECARISDINEHLPTLKKYASECDHITELGVRRIVSTWAFLAGDPKKLVSVDIKDPRTVGHNLDEVYSCAKELGIEFEFVLGSDLEVPLEETDLLFIDTWHVYEQMKQELELLGPKAKKYIIMHDTVTFGQTGESTGHTGILPAIIEFIKVHKEWKIKEQFFNNNGLMVLEKI